MLALTWQGGGSFRSSSRVAIMCRSILAPPTPGHMRTTSRSGSNWSLPGPGEINLGHSRHLSFTLERAKPTSLYHRARDPHGKGVYATGAVRKDGSIPLTPDASRCPGRSGGVGQGAAHLRQRRLWSRALRGVSGHWLFQLAPPSELLLRSCSNERPRLPRCADPYRVRVSARRPKKRS